MTASPVSDRWYPRPRREPVDRDELRERVAVHIGAAKVDAEGRMCCPACGGMDFGPTLSLNALSVYEDGYLPGAPVLGGACLGCGHTTSPAATPVEV